MLENPGLVWVFFMDERRRVYGVSKIIGCLAIHGYSLSLPFMEFYLISFLLLRRFLLIWLLQFNEFKICVGISVQIMLSTYICIKLWKLAELSFSFSINFLWMWWIIFDNLIWCLFFLVKFEEEFCLLIRNFTYAGWLRNAGIKKQLLGQLFLRSLYGWTK